MSETDMNHLLEIAERWNSTRIIVVRLLGLETAMLVEKSTSNLR
jgi:hypothetical protein